MAIGRLDDGSNLKRRTTLLKLQEYADRNIKRRVFKNSVNMLKYIDKSDNTSPLY